MSRRVYKNPPIEEAICELRFAPSQEWNATLPGLFYELIRAEYPAKPREHRMYELRVEEGTQSPRPEVIEQTSRTQFLNDEENRIIGIGVDVISVHVLRPYESWDGGFRKRVENALEAYIKVAKPAGLVRIGLRYLNKFKLPSEAQDLTQYFTVPVGVPNGLPNEVRSFLQRYEFVYPDSSGQLNMTFGTLPVPNKREVLLDIDIFQDWLSESPLPTDATLSTLDDLKLRERAAFEAMITDKTRALLDE